MCIIHTYFGGLKLEKKIFWRLPSGVFTTRASAFTISTTFAVKFLDLIGMAVGKEEEGWYPFQIRSCFSFACLQCTRKTTKK